MSYIDKFRKLLGLNLRDTNRQMTADAESATHVLNQNAAALVGKVYRDAEANLDRMIAEREKQFDQVKPFAFEGTFEELPAPAQAQLAAPTKPVEDEPQPEAPAMPPPVVAGAAPVEGVNDPSPRRTATPGKKRNRLPHAG